MAENNEKLISLENLDLYDEKIKDWANNKVAAHTDNGNVHVTTTDKSNWNNKLDSNQGSDNAGKVLGTNANGEVIPLNGYGFEYNEETQMLEYGTDPTTKLNQGIGLDDSLSKKGFAADSAAVGELRQDLVDNYVQYKVTSINKFDKTKVTVGYVNYQTGQIAKNTGYRTSDFIPVEVGENYKIVNNGNQQVACYNTNKEYVTGYSTANSFNTDSIPEGVSYIRFCFAESYLDAARFYKNVEHNNLQVWEDTSSFNTANVADSVKGDVVEYEATVETINDLINRINSIRLTDGYHYTIYLAEGTYTLTYDLIQTLSNPTYGIMLPNNVDLVGLGKSATIECDLTGQSANAQQMISPLNIKWNNNLTNIKVIANNCRYAVHADNSNQMHNNLQVFTDCEFIHKGNSDGNWAYPSAWGEGTSSGADVTFNNCKFVSPFRAYYIHNNTDFDNPSHHTYNNCAFVGTDNNLSFAIESMNSTVNDVLEFNGCTFFGMMDCRVNPSAPSGTVSNDFEIIGSGNSCVAENFYFTDGKQYFCKFSDEVIKIYNTTSSTLSKNKCVKYVNGEVVPMEDGDDASQFYGYVLDDIESGAYGYIKVRGYIRVLGWVSNQTEGKAISVSNGEISVANSGEYTIGKVAYKNTKYNRQFAMIHQ